MRPDYSGLSNLWCYGSSLPPSCKAVTASFRDCHLDRTNWQAPSAYGAKITAEINIILYFIGTPFKNVIICGKKRKADGLGRLLAGVGVYCD